MKIIIPGVIAFFLLGNICIAQKYFEGEIEYTLSYKKKDSAFDLRSIPLYPAEKITMLFKNGNWVLLTNTGVLEYVYQDVGRNIYYEKYRGVDTIYYQSSGMEYDMKDSITKIEQYKNTDTILGRVCNKVTFHTTKLKLSMLYNAEIAADPDWYKFLLTKKTDI